MSAPLAKSTGKFSETVIDDEIVVMSLESGDFFSLTGTARAIWQLIDGAHSRDAVVSALAEQFGCAAADIGDDVDMFLAQLQDAGLLAPA